MTLIISEPKPLRDEFRVIMYDPECDWADYYFTKLAARGGVMLHAVNLGWTLEDCRGAFLKDANPGSVLWTQGTDGRWLGPHEATRRLRADHVRASAKAAQEPAYRSGQEVRQELAVQRAAVAALPWTGRTGRTDRDVLLGALDHMIKVGSDRIDYSVRDASLGAGVYPQAARRSLKRLVQAGWLEVSQPERKKEGSQLAPSPALANTYRFTGVRLSPHMNLKDSSPREGYVGCKPNTYDAGHETWVRLGKAAGSIWSELAHDPQGVRQLARAAGVSPSTCSNHLPKLAEHKLADRLEAGWVRGPATPAEVAETKGWAGNESKTAKRRKEFALDRIAHDITRGQVTVAQAKAAHPGLASEIERKFGGLEAEDKPLMAAVA
jgi:hypothetical protein